MRASGNGNLTCPECMCIASNIIHHQPIRLDDGFLYLRNISQKVLGRSEGHFCSICHEDFKLRDTELGTMDTTKPWCDHIFCFHCLSKRKCQRITENKLLECPNCRAASKAAQYWSWSYNRWTNRLLRSGHGYYAIYWHWYSTWRKVYSSFGSQKVEKLSPWRMQQEGAQMLARGLARSSLLPVDTWRSVFLLRAQWALYKMG
jgi:hypothetical protein